MQRRNFLGAVGAGAGALAVGSTGARAESTNSDRIGRLVFDSTASLLGADGTPAAADAEFVAVRAESTAVNVNEDGNGGAEAAVDYPDDRPIPLVGVDGGVVGFGAPIVQNGTDFTFGNEEFVLNALDRVAGSGTVVFDETHGQFYDAEKHTAFIQYAESNGYAVEATGADGDFAGALSTADAAIVTSPSEGFSAPERDALATFVANGGGLLVFHQSDFNDFDATGNLNEVAAALDLGFRFNDDQVIDETNNAGVGFVPTTDRFDADYAGLFANRPGLGFEIDPSRTYTAEVVRVTDGDTVDVRIPRDGVPDYFDTVRLLGIDTPETAAGPELPAEWEGIDSLEYLLSKGAAAEAWAVDQLAGATVGLSFDPEEGVRGNFGRLLCYLRYDADGDGARDTLYNRRAVAEGYARVYDSGLTRHDAFVEIERVARKRGLGVWAESDVDTAPPTRPSRVRDVLFPKAVPVDPGEGGEVIARAASSASRPSAPLAAVDEDAGVALVGAQTVDEDYDEADTPVDDPSAYDYFQFTAGVIGALTERAGEVLVDGGHGQFAAEESVCAEDAAFFQRYLEGLDVGFTQFNTLSMGELARGRAVIVSAPTEAYDGDELAALRRYARGGGAVVVLADRTADRARVNDLLASLDADIRVGSGVVDDPRSNAGRPDLPVTSDTDIDPPEFEAGEDEDAGEDEGESGREDEGESEGERKGRRPRGGHGAPGGDEREHGNATDGGAAGSDD
ncbi:DUF4350 domain-containing protein [Halobaculum sp. EA56]|uniref:DUF4350 domain-containing protein n=1 Tax=Halobaculum sp. EA56 TaxID=3421648 RepID=UPI003EC1148E